MVRGVEMRAVDVPGCSGDEGSHAQEDDSWGAHVDRNVMGCGKVFLRNKT